MSSSFFVWKSRKRYGCEMPALRAISSVEAIRPCWAKTSRAASRTSSLRSSADLRIAVLTRCKLSLTHNCGQGLDDAVELRIGEPRVQRERQAALEARVRPR